MHDYICTLLDSIVEIVTPKYYYCQLIRKCMYVHTAWVCIELFQHTRTQITDYGYTYYTNKLDS